MITETISKYVLPSGIRKSAYAGIACVVFALFDLELFAWFALCMLMLFLYIYRKPIGMVTDIASSGIIAPLDGKVVHIDEFQEGDFGYRIIIASSYFDSGVLFAPFNSSVESATLYRGARLPIASKHYKKLNERLELLFLHEKNYVRVEHMLQRSIVSIELFCTERDELSCAQSYGYANNAHTVIYLPNAFRWNVKVGTKVLGGKTVLGYFSRVEDV